MDVVGYLYILIKKDIRNRFESIYSYLIVSLKLLIINKKIMYLRLNGLFLLIVIWMESCFIGINIIFFYI